MSQKPVTSEAHGGPFAGPHATGDSRSRRRNGTEQIGFTCHDRYPLPPDISGLRGAWTRSSPMPALPASPAASRSRPPPTVARRWRSPAHEWVWCTSGVHPLYADRVPTDAGQAAEAWANITEVASAPSASPGAASASTITTTSRRSTCSARAAPPTQHDQRAPRPIAGSTSRS